MKIQKHTELEVYKKAFDAAMQIFELTKSFPKEETYSLTDQFGDPQDLFALIWQRLGVSGAMRLLSSQNFRMPRVRGLKLKSGSNLRLGVAV